MRCAISCSSSSRKAQRRGGGERLIAEAAGAAGMAHRTCRAGRLTSSVSASQSATHVDSCRKLPELSPFSHSRCLERLKNTTRPRASVAPAPRDPCSRASARCRAGVLHDRGHQAAVLVPVEALDVGRAVNSQSHLDALAAQFALELRNENRAAVKHARRQRGIDLRVAKRALEMLHAYRRPPEATSGTEHSARTRRSCSMS
jgi:hypothetical protein